MWSVAAVGGGFMAAESDQHADPDAAGNTSFDVNAIEHLPRVPSVVGHAFSQRQWLVIWESS